VKILNSTKNTTLAENCTEANTFMARFLGLMGKKYLSPNYALILAPCNSVHMFFMRFALDVVFIDKDNMVIYLAENLKPWRLSRIIPLAYAVIEVPTGTIKNSKVSVGDTLKMICP
jgi:hypothetical protein